MIDLILSSLALFFSLHGTVVIEQMGDERFAVRDAACRSLIGMLQQDGGVLLIPRLEHAAGHRDPEVARRARWAVEEFYNVWPSTANRVPWIDMLPEKMPQRQAIMDYYLARVRSEVSTPGPPDWFEYRLATVYFLNERLRTGTPRSQLVRLLDEMIVNEERYLSRR